MSSPDLLRHKAGAMGYGAVIRQTAISAGLIGVNLRALCGVLMDEALQGSAISTLNDTGRYAAAGAIPCADYGGHVVRAAPFHLPALRSVHIPAATADIRFGRRVKAPSNRYPCESLRMEFDSLAISLRISSSLSRCIMMR